jgi:hypothetical protein
LGLQDPQDCRVSLDHPVERAETEFQAPPVQKVGKVKRETPVFRDHPVPPERMVPT